MRRRLPLISFLLVVLVAVGVFALPRPGRAERPAPKNRVLILGFDGAAAQRVERMMAEDKLPHLAALRGRGGYARLATSNPAQSPVAWASLTTGRNPGETGIYDFLKRSFTPGSPGVGIKIGLAEPVPTVVLSSVQRVAAVTLAGVVGALIGGFIAWFVLARFSSDWRRGGRLQAALCAPAALLSMGALLVVSWVPETVPFARNLRGGEPFWVTLDKAGLVCEALEAPLAFPADHMQHGSCLAGLGVPDAQATWGSWAIWTDDHTVPAETETAGTGYFVGPRVDAFDLVLAGPLDPLPDPEAVTEATRQADIEKYRREAALEWSIPRRRKSETDEALMRLTRRLTTTARVALRRGEGATLTTAEGVVVELTPDKWSELVPVAFAVSPLARVSAKGRVPGRVRFRISFGGATPGADAIGGSFRLFVAPVNLDCSAELPKNMAISSPPEFMRDLAEKVGPFETLGWPELTNPVKDDLLSDEFFLEHIKVVMEGREARLKSRIVAGGWDCLFTMFCETDRVQHVLWRHTDPKSPTYDPEVSPRFADAIDNIYLEMDRIVGEAVAAVGPDTHVLVVSDHGFAPFRRGVNINNFLRAEGLQVAHSGAGGGPQSVAALATPGGGSFFPDVDWTRTQAYAMGLGNIFINLKGREPGGIVDPDDAPALIEEIRTKLLALNDTDGTKVTREVYRGSDLYSGARVSEAPDLVAGFESGYRVSWQNCLGAIDSDVITDNTQRWSADHCSVDPSLVPGILFSSAPLEETATPSVLDVVPSLLDLLGVTTRPDLEGSSFLSR